MRVVLRTFLQILNASTGKRTLIAVAIISVAAIVVLVAVSFRNELIEGELIGALPVLPPASPTELQLASPLETSSETAMQSPEASRELVPSPRPRPMHKRLPRQAHNIRNIPDNVLPILLAGSIDVQPLRPLAALMAAPRASDAETLEQDSVTSRDPGRLLPPADPIQVQPVGPLAASTAAAPAGDAETAMGSGASQELVPSPPSRRAHKSRPRRAHNGRNRSNSGVPTLPLAGPAEVQPMRPLAGSTAAPAGDAETAIQRSEASWELVPSPSSRRAHKSRPRRAHNMRNRSNSGVPTLPQAGPTEVQPMRPLAASTAAAPAGDAETEMRRSGVSRELVPSPPSRRVQKWRPRLAHNMRNPANSDVPTLPPAGPTEVQPMRPLAASTAAPPAGAETAMQSSGPSRELVPSPRPRPVHKPRLRPKHNIRNVPNDVGLRDAVAILKDLRESSQIDRVVKDNPSNVFLLLIAEIRRASQETGRRIEKLIDEIEPPTLPKELNYAIASRAQLEAYRLDLKAAEANAMAAMSRYEALLESEHEKVEVVVRLLDIDDRYIRAALSGIDKRQAQSKDITSKMLSANAEFYRATGECIAFLIEQFEHYKVSTNGHFMFSSQLIADRYEVASKQINDAMKRIAELEEEQRKLAQFQQEEWERFASGN
jgi:hypothetical protein